MDKQRDKDPGSGIIYKYVCIDFRKIILFTDMRTKHKEFEKMGKITSAAFCIIADNGVMTYGESLSLGMAPHPDDAELIRKGILT